LSAVRILNKEKALLFYNKYYKNIYKFWYYNNKSLNVDNLKESIIDDSFDNYTLDDKNRSHFAFIMTK
jgi:hypothetical protein